MKKTINLKQGISVFLVALLMMSVTSVCVSAEAVSLENLTSFVFCGNSVTVKQGESTNYEVLVIDKQEYETEPVESTDENGNTIYSLPEASEGILQVCLKKKGGEYVFSGNGTGAIKVSKEGTAATTIYLDGLTLYSDFTACIVANKNNVSPVTIYATEGSVNNLSDSAYNNDDLYEDVTIAEKAVIKAKAGTDLVFKGTGTVNIEANGKNAIKVASVLTIDDITLNIDVLDNGISGEESITINSGNFTIISQEGDGIKCCAEEEPEGDITINGGKFDIDVLCDGIQATKNLTINGGEFDIVTYNGYNAPDYDCDDDSFPSAKGLKASGSYIVTDDEGNESEIDATECQLNINAGTFHINCADDAIHSDKDLTINGGSFVISSGDDAIHSEYVTTLGNEGADNSLLSVTINNSVEGIEGATVNIYSGIYKVFSTDDCINAANSDLVDYIYEINVFGGDIYASCYEGDCFDSNKNITIYDGRIIALGAINSFDGEALDCDGSLSIKGGQVLTVQNGNGMGPSMKNSTGVIWTGVGISSINNFSSIISGGRPEMNGNTGFISNGSEIVVCDKDGNILINTTAEWIKASDNKAGKVMYFDSNVSSGESYTLSVDGETEGSFSSSSFLARTLQMIKSFFSRIIEWFRNLFVFSL